MSDDVKKQVADRDLLDPPQDAPLCPVCDFELPCTCRQDREPPEPDYDAPSFQERFEQARRIKYGR